MMGGLRAWVLGGAVAVFLTSAPVRAIAPAQTDVVIVGAGLSGLATAYQLKKAGIRYHLLELTPRVGGRVRTVQYPYKGKMLTADSGMEEYWESNPAVQVLRELKLPLRGDVAQSSIVLNGKLELLGDETKEQFLKRILEPTGYQALKKFEGTVAPLLAKLRGRTAPDELLKLKDISFAQWVGERKLPPKVADWIRVSIECEIGATWDRISALDGIAEFHIFVGPGEKSYRVDGGNEKFVAALAHRVGRGAISLNHRVNRVVTEGNSVVVHYLDQATNLSSTIRASHVVSTIPLYRMFEVQFVPALSPKKLAAMQSQSWGAYFKAHIFLPPEAQSRWMPNGASVLPILSDSELGVIYDGNPDQPTGTRLLSLLITGPHAEAFNMMPLDLVRAKITGKLETLWPGIGAQIENIEFYRYHPRAIAAWAPGRSRYDELSQEIRRPENRVYFGGDFTETSHSDGAFIAAQRVVKDIVLATALEKKKPTSAVLGQDGVMREPEGQTGRAQ